MLDLTDFLDSSEFSATISRILGWIMFRTSYNYKILVKLSSINLVFESVSHDRRAVPFYVWPISHVLPVSISILKSTFVTKSNTPHIVVALTGSSTNTFQNSISLSRSS